MFRNCFIIILLAGSFLISCKSTPAEDISEPQTEIAEGISGEEAPIKEEFIEENRTDNTIESTSEAAVIAAETDTPATGDQSGQVIKIPSKSGGMKTRIPRQSETVSPDVKSEDPDLIQPGDSSDETLIEPPVEMTAADIAVPEIPLTASDSESVPDISLPGNTVPAEQPEIFASEESGPSATAAADSSDIPPASGLPSDIEVNSYNPLLPVVIVPGNQSSGTDSSQSGSQPSEMSSPAPDEEAIKSTVLSPSLPEKTVQDAVSINRDQTPAGSETAVTQPPALMESDVYSLSADLSGKLVIFLEGAGWIYLSSSTDGISLRDKSYDPASGRTRFVFSGSDLKKSGVELIFLKQDLLRGESSQQSLVLDGSNNPLLAEEKTSPAADVSTPVAVIPDQTPVPSAAGDSTVLSNEQNLQEETVPAGVSSEQTASVTVTGTEESTFPPVGLSPSELLDLAGRFEMPGPDQSLEKAIFLYEKIRSDYPVTEERFIADERIRYLNKHYFKVQ